jgi:hypothetical protein
MLAVLLCVRVMAYTSSKELTPNPGLVRAAMAKCEVELIIQIAMMIEGYDNPCIAALGYGWPAG